MAAKCCHPLLLWILHFLMAIIALVVSLFLLFTLFTARPLDKASTRQTLTLTITEKCTIAHLAFSLLGLVFLNHIMRLISTGGHRDDFYRVEKDFKILAGLAIFTSLIIAICGILVYVYREEALNFELLPEYTRTQHQIDVDRFLNAGKTTTSRPLPETNVPIYILYLLIADLAGLILCVVDVLIVVGCNKRERYQVESAVEKAMLARQAGRAPRSLSSRSPSRYELES